MAAFVTISRLAKWALFSTLLVAISLCGSVSEAKTQTKNIQTGNTAIDKLEVHFIDVGRGDATLIQCGDAAMLIDAGESDKGTAAQEYIKEQGVKSLDYLIVTEPEAEAPQDNQSQTVHITKTGRKYHNAGYASLSKSDMEVTLDEALSKGLGPCKRCH